MVQALLRAIPFKVKLFVATLGLVALIINVDVMPTPQFSNRSEQTSDVVRGVPVTRITLTTNFCPTITNGVGTSFHAKFVSAANLPWDALVNATNLYHMVSMEGRHTQISEPIYTVQFRVNPEAGPAEGTLEYSMTYEH